MQIKLAFQKLIRGTLLSALFLLIFLPTGVQAQDERSIWEIQSFDAKLIAHDNGRLEITERIDVEFFVDRRGIFRNIPTGFNGNNEWIINKVQIKVLSIENQNGKKWNYEVTNNSDHISIRIGEESTYIKGKQTYIIKYRMDHAAAFYDDYDEIYWNVTGNQWPVEIKRASAEVIYPTKLDSDDVDAACFTGVYGSTESACTFEIGDNSVVSKSVSALAIDEGLTLAVALPKGTITPPSQAKKLTTLALLNLGAPLPLITGAVLFVVWSKYGKDRKGRGTIVRQYEAPAGLRPAEVGVLVDNSSDDIDVSATIIDLAVRGYLVIHEEKKKYSFRLTNNDFSSLKNYERKLMEGIFGTSPKEGIEISLSTLKNSFYTTTAAIKEQLYSNLIAGGHYSKHPNQLKGTLMFFAILIGVGGVIPVGILLGDYFLVGIGSILGIIVSALMTFIVAFWMPQRTAKGSHTYEDILGLKEYISTAEKDRLEKMQGADSEYVMERTNEPKKTAELFEKLLPYAIVLKVEKSWADKFKDIYTTPPSWYEGGNWSTFNTAYMMSSLNNATNTMNSTFVSQPSSSGSGFSGGSSGGGFGGGGGGSW